ncbi:LysE family translocator [Saccharopolyspora pogona]|uniref:LysE family translocator n=1 Tax=Saccharopolyspora pogona TaxID=333966 RepID=UPI001CC22DE4|nr:LysE family translocator [Saccharopolyspora pogona]
MGARALWELRKGTGGQPQEAPRQRGSAVLQGFVSEVFNPKTAMFFLAFLPQFVHPERGSTSPVFLVLGAVFVAFVLVSDLLVASFAGPLSARVARNPRWWRRQQVASGTTLIGLGEALALSQNQETGKFLFFPFRAFPVDHGIADRAGQVLNPAGPATTPLRTATLGVHGLRVEPRKRTGALDEQDRRRLLASPRTPLDQRRRRA